jgi:DNA polymerase-3 subunit gamma/tau
MSLDTKYRPLRYSDVLGQQATIQVCRELVRKGQGFRQSYVFAGAWGSGKTTLARILARAVLCENPQDGEPCDRCLQCTSILEERSENFIEVDAATNSSKEDIKRITEEASFGSFSGQRKIYLLDECHQLSKQSMDALLKPLEDNIRGTQDKQLVCLFCTTEPEKMRKAITSRCAPVFRIRPNTPDEVAARLDYICEQEGIERDPAVLSLIAEVTECHVRDSIKAIEGVSMLGRIDHESVTTYLHLDANALFLDLLEEIGTNLPSAMGTVEKLLTKVSPSSCYERMADVAMLAYRLNLLKTAAVPSYWNRARLEAVGDVHREFLVSFAERFAQRPHHATASMFTCDVASLHQMRTGMVVRATATEVLVPTRVAAPAAEAPVAPLVQVAQSAEEGSTEVESQGGLEYVTPPDVPPERAPAAAPLPAAAPGKNVVDTGSVKVAATPVVTTTGVYLHPSAQNRRAASPQRQDSSDGHDDGNMPSGMFQELVRRWVIELTREQQSSGRSTRRADVGNP